MNDLRPAEDGTLAVTVENLAKLDESPLLAAPADLRRPVFATWSMFRHLTGLETSAPLSFAVGMWVSEHGVDKEVIRKALRELTSPAVMRSIRYASDLTATLAEMVMVKRRPTMSSNSTPYEPYENFIPKPRPADDH